LSHSYHCYGGETAKSVSKLPKIWNTFWRERTRKSEMFWTLEKSEKIMEEINWKIVIFVFVGYI
jgi:hypothetical protein